MFSRWVFIVQLNKFGQINVSAIGTGVNLVAESEGDEIW
jgi:hypothetical protein